MMAAGLLDWVISARCAVCAKHIGEQREIWWYQETADSVLYTFCSDEHRARWLQEIEEGTAVPETLVRCALCDTEIQEAKAETLSSADSPDIHFCCIDHLRQWWEKQMAQQRQEDNPVLILVCTHCGKAIDGYPPYWDVLPNGDGLAFCSQEHWALSRTAPQPSLVLTLNMKSEFVSCVTCAACYDDRNQPTYCQEFKTAVDPRKIGHNMRTATQCTYFWPHGFPREARAHV